MSTYLKEVEASRKERQSRFSKSLYRFYEVPKDATLAVLSLEEGNALPDDAAAEIMEAQIVEDKRGGENIAEVQATKRLLWAGTYGAAVGASWEELFDSRKKHDTDEYVDYVCRFQGGHALTCPERGSKISDIIAGQSLSSTELVSEPEAILVQQEPHGTRTYQFVTVHFRGYRAFA